MQLIFQLFLEIPYYNIEYERTYFLVKIRNNTVDYMKLEIVNGLYYSEKIKLKLRLWNTQKIN